MTLKFKILYFSAFGICFIAFSFLAYLLFSPLYVFKDEKISSEKGELSLFKEYRQISGDVFTETHQITIDYPLVIRENESKIVNLSYNGIFSNEYVTDILGAGSTVKLDSTPSTFSIAPASEQKIAQQSKSSLEARWYIQPLKKGSHYLYINASKLTDFQIYSATNSLDYLSKINKDLCPNTPINPNNKYIKTKYNNDDELPKHSEANRYKLLVSTNGKCTKLEASGLIDLPISVVTVLGINQVTAKILTIVFGGGSLFFIVKIIKKFSENKSIRDNVFVTHIGDKSVSENYNNDMKDANIGNFANKVQDNARQQANQNIYESEQRETLAEAAEDIQNLLKVLEENNPTATEIEKKNFVTSSIPPERRSRIVKALEAGGEKALQEFLKNPYVNVVVAIVKEWRKTSPPK